MVSIGTHYTKCYINIETESKAGPKTSALWDSMRYEYGGMRK